MSGSRIQRSMPEATDTHDHKKSGAAGRPAPRRGLYIKTFGCQMNVYDSQKLARLLENEYVQVSAPQEADLIIVNTCSVRAKPQQKVYSILGEFRKLKRQNPALLVGVGGCVAQQEGERLLSGNDAVDFVFGTHNLSVVPALIARRRQGAPPEAAVDFRSEWEDLPLGLGIDNQASVFVSISRGCNNKCAYCIVPFTRGPEISRPADEIEREVRLLIAKGAKEVVLLGQNVNSYGLDFSPSYPFEDLVERLAGLEGLLRLRFTSPHPRQMGPRFVELVTSHSKVCRHLHMPLQSGSNRVLAMMNRGYTRERYLELAAALKAGCAEMALTTDIIVGFPGESEDDFKQTLDVMERAEFDSSYSFVYSPRPGTAAAVLPEQIEEEVKSGRLARLQAAQDRITARRLAAWHGREVEVLLDGSSRSDGARWQGRTSQNLVVNLDKVYAGLAPGMLVEVRITGIGKHTLHGEALGVASPQAR